MSDKAKWPAEPAVLIVTGGSKGLGLAVARAWARPGRKVAIAARDEARLLQARDDLAAAGAEVLTVRGDVGEAGFPEHLAAETVRRLGPVTHIVTCASSLGPLPLGPLADVDDAGWHEVLATNILGTVRLWRAVLGPMEGELGGGRIVHVSSDAAVEAYPHWGPYGATKAAVDHLTRILAAELQEHAIPNVHVYAFDPGDMDTDMHRAALSGADPGGLPRPQEVAPAVLKLLLQVPALPSGRYLAGELLRGEVAL